MAVSRTLKLQLQLILMLTVCCSGLADLYANSFISPNSAEVNDIKDIDKQQPAENPAVRTSGPGEILSSTLAPTSLSAHRSESSVIRSPRSASPDPILSTVTATDDLLIYKNVEDALDTNDVELSGRIGGFINPSKTNRDLASNSLFQTIVPPSGEAWGAPHARALPEPQEILASATTAQNSASRLPQQSQGRQANPDIQEIITGIVKLLNGNVNVQANTAPAVGRPIRPFSTRINNRGPPRITDVPALPPDFDVPALPPPPLGPVPPPLSSTRLPTPYPFDVPNMSPARPAITGTNIPLSEQSPLSKRPGFYRPVTSPPWNRRRPPNRRPSVPPYKPMPPLPSDLISFTSDKPIEDILTLDIRPHLETSESENIEDHNGDRNVENIQSGNNNYEVTTNPVAAMTSEIDEDIAEFEKNKEKVTKLDKYTSKTTSITPTFASEEPQNSKTTLPEPPVTLDISSSINSNTSSFPEPLQTSTNLTDVANSIIETTSVVKEELTPTITTSSYQISVNSTPRVEENITTIESSMKDVLQTLGEELPVDVSTLSSTATETLPETNLITTSSSESTTSTTSTDTMASSNSNQTSTSSGFPYYPYRPRPGIVLDDTEYKPGGINRQPIITRPPIGQIGDIFDITVSAIQGPGGSSVGQGKPYIIPVDIDNIHGANNQDVITSSTGSEGFVSIDGKRTYLNLFGDATPATSTGVKPSAALHNQVTGTGFAVVDEKPAPGIGAVKPTHRRPIYSRPRPSQPPVRIDTCIVGDDSTCDVSQHEICKTELGVSACHCRPGTARRKHRDPCRKIVSILVSLRVDKLYDRKVIWASELANTNSESFQQLSYEAERALESAMSMTPFSDEFLAAKVNNIYRGDRTHGQGGVFVNLTLQLDENADTSRPTVKGDIQRHLLGVIQRRSNNVGESALWVDSPPGSISNLQDLDECSSPELHDCHSLAKCINIFGGFKCECNDGYRDPWLDNKHRSGRHCEQCSPQYCNNRGECKYQNGHEICVCSGNYYGNQCELDGEVLGVAIGASVAAVVIIGLTLVCLLMWSRRWNREQKAAVGSPVFGYMATASNTVKAPVMGAPPYQLTLEDRLRWAQIADVMAQANHYAPEPGMAAPTRPSSAMFGYPNLSHIGTLPHHGSLPPVPLPRLNLQAAQRASSIRPPESTSSGEEDKADLLGRSFQVPRPKSRSNASIANQSGIYYDVDYDQNELYKQAGSIPLSTYSMGRQQYFRN